MRKKKSRFFFNSEHTKLIGKSERKKRNISYILIRYCFPDKNGNVLDPRYPTFIIEGVTSVWKRFYLNHCQLQILFNNSMGNELTTYYNV
jgi:hypothetical protein